MKGLVFSLLLAFFSSTFAAQIPQSDPIVGRWLYNGVIHDLNDSFSNAFTGYCWILGSPNPYWTQAANCRQWHRSGTGTLEYNGQAYYYVTKITTGVYAFSTSSNPQSGNGQLYIVTFSDDYETASGVMLLEDDEGPGDEVRHWTMEWVDSTFNVNTWFNWFDSL